MALFLVGILILLAGGTLSLLLPGFRKVTLLLLSSLVSLVLILVPSFFVLFTNQPLSLGEGLFRLRTDATGAFFQMMIAAVFFISVLFSSGLLFRKKNSLSGRFLFCMTLTAVSFLLLTVSVHSVLILFFWQLLILSFWFSGSDGPGGRNWLSRYGSLVFIEFGFLLVAAGFLVYSAVAGGAGPGDAFGTRLSASSGLTVFLLMTAGFSSVAVWPYLSNSRSREPLTALFSVFLPAAALFGILRAVLWIGDSGGLLPAVFLAVASAAGAIAGTVFSVRQKNLASFISFCGPASLGLSGLAAALGMTGLVYGNNVMAVCGFSASLFQVVNFSIARSLLLCSAGNAAPDGNFPLDRPSGLYRRGPFSGIFFFIGALAVTGLPAMDGFMNFFLNSFGIASAPARDPIQSVILVCLAAGTVVPVLILFSFFLKTYPLVWLSGKTDKTRTRLPGRVPVALACLILLAFVLVTGIFPQYVAIFTVNPAADLANTAATYTDHNVMSVYSRVFNSLNMVSKTILTFAGLALILYLVRIFVLTDRELSGGKR